MNLDYLTFDEISQLQQIRRRKEDLLKEIKHLQDEIDSVSKEIYFNNSSTNSFSKLLSNNEEKEENEKVVKTEPPGNANNSKKLYNLGCKKFNMKPANGIEFLLTNGCLGNGCEIKLEKQNEKLINEVAQFLYRGECLNKTAIGEFLGEKNDFNEAVLRSFVSLHDFTNLILVQALRQFLWSFRLPGEAQKIDRMMECFANRYCQLNPDIFHNNDTCYILSFAIIMLNTSLHNKSVKEKPTLEHFVKMNRGINNGTDLPRELLSSFYNSILSEPFKIPNEDDGNDLMLTFFNPDKEGWLWKQGGRYKSWKRRWFILNDNCLYYFEFTTDKEPRGIIPLENIFVRSLNNNNTPNGGVPPSNSTPGGQQNQPAQNEKKEQTRFVFEIYSKNVGENIKACKTDSNGRVIEGKHTVYRFSTNNLQDRNEWVECIQKSTKLNEFQQNIYPS